MVQVTRRERLRAATEQEIRQYARTLLATQGREAVTLRAIARELGITAPALYRYYGSREELLRALCNDICSDLAEQLHHELRRTSGELAEKVRTACWEFRRWALHHPEEFALVFATPPGDDGQQDQFARVFLGIVAPLMREGAVRLHPDRLPVDLPDVSAYQNALADAFDAEGITVPAEAISPESVYYLLRWWARLYGHVALEVFGRFPFDLRHADELFNSLLQELLRESGL